MFKTIGNILNAVNITVNNACTLVVKTMSAAEDLVDTVNVHTSAVLNETLEENSLEMKDLEKKYQSRLEFLTIDKPKS